MPTGGDALEAGAPEKEVAREVVFAALAVISVLIGISRIADPRPAPIWMQSLDVVIAAAFLFDWVLRIRGSGRPLRYLATHSYEVLFFVPYTLLPTLTGGNILRGARLLRLVRLLRYGRFVKVGVGVSRLPRRVQHLQRIVDNAHIVPLLVAGLVTVNLGALGLFLVERLGSYGDALWRSLSLFSTAAYAVPPPQTSAGHLVSAFLMIGGVAYFGIFTASLASAILRTPAIEENT